MRAMNNISKTIAHLSLYTSFCVAIGFLFAPIPNIELITLSVFLGGYIFGPVFGAFIGGTAMFIYSAFNPWGSGLAFPPMLTAQVIGFAIAGFSGGIVRSLTPRKASKKAKSIVYGISGGLLTIVYSVLLSLFSSMSAGFTLGQSWIFLIGSIWVVWHILSNILIFALLAPKLIRVVQRSVFINGIRNSGVIKGEINNI